MFRGMYAAATGMIAQQFVQDAIASNLANTSTAGYKQEVPTFKALQEMALRRYGREAGERGVSIGTVGLGVQLENTVINQSDGSLMPTSNRLDIALSGEGFYAVETPQGERYTRNGQFRLELSGKGPDGKQVAYLTDQAGHRVLGTKGPINLAGVNSVVVDESGRITADGVPLDQFKIVNAKADVLEREGRNLYALRGAAIPPKVKVHQGYVEQSNVNAIRGMIQIITVQRAYEAAQRAITSQDETLGKVVNEVGKV